MNFLEWRALNEVLSQDYLKRAAKDMLSFFSKKGYEYAVPDFEVFHRKNEPLQQNILFTDRSLRTFTLNYTQNGSLFSVDFWKPDSKKPVKTLYVEGAPIYKVLRAIPLVSENPNIKVAELESLMSELVEAQKENIKITNPKPEVSLDPEVRKAEAKMKDEYDYSDPETIFEDLEKYVNMVIRGVQPSLIITGSPGVGKTHIVLKELKKAGMVEEKDFVHIKGKSSPYAMFQALYENREKLIVFDDCDSVFASPDSVNILKGALDSYGERKISWLVKKSEAAAKELPKTFVFNGRIIFISNLPQRKIDDAIKTRSFVLEVALTPKDMLIRMRDQLKEIMPEVPLPIKEEAVDFIESISNSVENLEINIRTLIKTVKILQSIDDLEIARRLIAQQCSYK
jgi:hypothetical protein